MLEARNHVEPHIHGIAGKGDIDAYRDKWCYANMMHFSSCLKLSSLFNSDGLPDEVSFRNLLRQEALDEAIAKNITLSNHADLCAWDHTYSGKFSLLSAWHLIRQRGFITQLSRNCCQTHLPLKVSIFYGNWYIMPFPLIKL